MKNESRRLKAGTACIGLALVLVWLTGCTSPDTLEKDYGNSVQNNIAQSVLNPQAGLVDTPTTGLTPKAGVNEMDAYNKGFSGVASASAGGTTGGGMTAPGTATTGGTTGTTATPGY